MKSVLLCKTTHTFMFNRAQFMFMDMLSTLKDFKLLQKFNRLINMVTLKYILNYTLMIEQYCIMKRLFVYCC